MLDKQTITKIKKASEQIQKELENIEKNPNIKTNTKKPAEYPIKCSVCGKERPFAFFLYDSKTKKFKCFRCSASEDS